MSRTGAVRWISALVLVLCAAPAIPDHDETPSAWFEPGRRIHRVRLNSYFYPSHRSWRWRFSARTEPEWRAIADELRIDPDRFPAGYFDRRTVVGLVHSHCVDVLETPESVEVLGAVVRRSGTMVVRWRYVYLDEAPGCAFPTVCWMDCLLWSFPRVEGRVRFRRQPARFHDIDCR